MAGGIVFVVAMVFVLPVGVMVGGALWSAVFGWLTDDDARRRASTEA